MNQDRILIVEDDPAVLHMLRSVLDYGGFAHESADTADQALQMFEADHFDAILLDLGLPDLHGSELIKTFREDSTVAILVVSGRGGEKERIDALDLGADDFVSKPFLPGELLARIRAAIRRTRPDSKPIRFGDVEFDPEQPLIKVGGDLVSLRKPEFVLLSTLARQPNTTISKEALCEAVWGRSEPNTYRNLRVLVNHLRAKLDSDGDSSDHIVAQRGFGYRLEI